MNLVRCDKGHFYDKEKYSTCPHCAEGTGADESLTSVFTEDVTEPAASVSPAASVTPMVQSSSMPVQDYPSSSIPASPLIQPVLSPDPFPIADMSADQNTVAMDLSNLDTPTVPLMEAVEEDDDDDHTVGFFDDDFFGSASDQTRETPSPVASVKAAKPVVNKVSTPCVGWLIALGGEHIGTDFRLKVGKNFIGRSAKMDVALTEDKSVSRDKHAIVVYEPKAHLYLVQPGEASSLVYKNNEVVLSPMKLQAYDTITVGDINLLFMPLCGERFNWSELLEEMKKRGAE